MTQTTIPTGDSQLPAYSALPQTESNHVGSDETLAREHVRIYDEKHQFEESNEPHSNASILTPDSEARVLEDQYFTGAGPERDVNEYLRLANERLLHPRGLHATLPTTRTLLTRIGYHEELDRLRDTARLGHAQSEPHGPRDNDTRQQRLDLLSGLARPLFFDPSDPKTAAQLQRHGRNWQTEEVLAKIGKKLDKKQAKWDRKIQKREDRAEERLDKVDRKLEKLHYKVAEHRRETERKIAEANSRGKPQEAQRIENDYEDKVNKFERKCASKIAKGERKAGRWIVVQKWAPEHVVATEYGMAELKI